jgi:uncharacterized protein YbbK (DUF523 family)
MSDDRLRIGISSCLLGRRVRYDGGHKRDDSLTDELGPSCRWVPVCPEFELGLGVPREAMRLAGRTGTPRLVTVKSRKDFTAPMFAYARRRVAALARDGLDGFVLKSRSPSCGWGSVPVHGATGRAAAGGSGLFARALREAMPDLPMEEEERLKDPAVRGNFLERALCRRRWRRVLRRGATKAMLREFHAAHASLFRARGGTAPRALDRRVAGWRDRPTDAQVEAYGKAFFAAIRLSAPKRGRARA